MWARLKQVGWTWKQGSGLHPYSYFRPGANTSLRKGALEGPGLLLDRGGRRAVCEVAACVEIKILRRVRASRV